MTFRALALTVALVALSWVCAAPVKAGVNQEIRFARGASSASVEGGVIRGERDVYTLVARKGQRMTVTITSVEDNAVFQIYPPESEEGLSGAADGEDAKTWKGALPVSGRYRIVVGGTRGNCTYTLKVGIK